MALFRIVPDVTGSRFLKMAAAKSEVLISQLTDHIATPFQRLSILGVQEVMKLLQALPIVTFWTRTWRLAAVTALLSCLDAGI